MRDLYATLFYKIKFTIEGMEPESDILWRVVLHIKEWMTRKHNKQKFVLSTDYNDWTNLKTGGKLMGKDIKIFSECCNVDEPFAATYWACKIIEYQKSLTGCAPRKWTTEIGFEPITSQKASFSCIISYSDCPGFLGEYEVDPTPNIPKIVKRIWEDPKLIVLDGIDTPTGEPCQLNPGDWVDFWERIKDNKRTMPYIYISPLNYVEEGKSPILVNPTEMAIAVGGNAKIFYGVNTGITDEMNYFCPEDYKCYDGAIRVYYPNINEDDPNDARRHRFLASEYIKSCGSEHIIYIIRRAIAQDANFYDRFFRVEDCRTKREAIIRKKRLEEIKKKHLEELASKDNQYTKELQNVEKSAMDIALEAEEKQLEALELADSLDEENKQLKEENYKLRIENESYLPLAKENADLRKVNRNRYAIKEYPKDPRDIFNYFDATFGDKIAFSDDAIASLKDCTIPSEELWKVFFSLSTVMTDLYINGSGDIFREFRNKTGIEISRGEGTMTRKDKKLMRQFTTVYHGETVNIEAHITYPSLKQSIHFGLFQKDNKTVVGWCGEHMDNYSTKKVH